MVCRVWKENMIVIIGIDISKVYVLCFIYYILFYVNNNFVREKDLLLIIIW